MSSKKLKIILATLFIALFGIALGIYKINCDKNAQRFYKQGMNFYKEKKYQDAYYNFKQIERVSSLYTLSLIKQYQCAMNLSDKKTAHASILKLVKLTKKSPARPWALYYETELNQELYPEKTEQNIKKYSYIFHTFPESDFSIASAYKSANLSKDSDKTLARDRYLAYLKEAPDGKYAASALEGLSGLRTGITKHEWEIIGDSYFLNKKYDEAINCYLNSDFSSSWYKISKTYKNLGNYELEKSTILKGMDLKTSSVEEKDIKTALERLSTITHTNKIQLLEGLYNSYQNSYIIPTVIYQIAENSNSVRSIKFYEQIVKQFPNSSWASNSLWEIFWYNYKLSRYKVCESLAKRHEALYSDSKDAPRVMYWYGKSLLKEHKNQSAKEIFNKVITNYPLSYYAYLSNRALKISKAKKLIIKKPIVSYKINTLTKYLFKDKILISLAQYDDWETIEELKINDDFIKSMILNKKGNYPMSIIYAKKGFEKKSEIPEEDIKNYDDKEAKLNFNNWELKLAYPVLYEDKINKYALENEQSPYLFLSLIREESHFDKNANSSAGAIGLSQLMKSTADFIKKSPQNKDTLLDPDENIKTGIEYFAHLCDLFNKNEYLAILGYNAGPGNIKKWLNDPYIRADEIDVFVENIPYLETKNYIKKILSSYWVYINIYSVKNRGI